MKPMNKDAISKRIRELRKNKEMTLEAWAALFGSNKSAGYKWENGTVPYRRTLEKMAEFSNVSVDWILYGDFVDYVIEFLQQFPLTYKMLITFEGKDCFSMIADNLSKEGKTYGDDTAILLEVLKNPTNQPAMSLLPEIQSYLKENEIEVKDLNIMPVDNLPEYRFNYIHRIDDLFMGESRLPEFEEFDGQKIHGVSDFFGTMMSYLIEQERLLKEWRFSINENANEEMQEHQRQFQKEQYIQASLATEQNLIEMLGGYRWLRDRVAEKYDLDVEKIRKSRHLPYYEIIRYDPEPLLPEE